MNSKQGLKALAESEGMEVMELLEKATFDGIAAGICLTCGYTCNVEPDCSDGYCEECRTQTVQSCLIIAGII